MNKQDYRTLFTSIALLTCIVVSLPSPAMADDLSEAEQQAIRAAVDAVADSVVQIQTVGGLEKVGAVLTSTAPTTGVIISEDGYIISSSFNFVQQPSAVLVSLPTGQEYPAKVVARDKSRRLVLLKIKPNRELPVPAAVDRQEVQVGQWAIAVGKSFDSRAANVSVGIVSATERIWGRAIQADAKVSPANYGGPLIDVYGRVIGILVPLSTEDGSELTGAEMYDSGIGFAVPFTDIKQRLNAMIEKKEMKPGLLGLTLKSKDLYRGQPVVASTSPRSPARDAGILPGDKLIRVADRAVETQSQLKHAIGPLYGGDNVDIVLLRDGEEQTVSLTLADRIEPYVHPFLGILPKRNRQDLQVRYVYPGSPAAEAGLQVEDRLLALNDAAIESASAWRNAIAELESGQSAKISFARGGKELQADVVLATLPTEIPKEIPAAGKGDTAEVVDFKLPAEANECYALVPESYSGEAEFGLVVWLAPPKFDSKEKVSERWSQLANEHQLIVLAPQSLREDRWLPPEAAVVRKFIDRAMEEYQIDSARVAVHGYQSGGSMAHRIALSNRNVVRAVAVVDATTSRGAKFRSNDPIERLAYYLFACRESDYFSFMQRDKMGLEALKFPVTEITVDEDTRYLDASELDDLARWINSLDRI